MILILITALLVAITGFFNLSEEGGIVNFLWLNQNTELFEELHEVFVNALIGLVIIHLIGIIMDSIFEKTSSALPSIFTGYKNIKGESVQLKSFQKAFSVIWIALSIGVFFYIYSNSTSLIGSNSDNETEQFENESDLD
jgi:hypothetical protein